MYYFESGSNTPKNTYADVGLTILNPHPVILSASGRLPNVEFDGTAKQILTDADDVQIWERDPVGSGVSGEFGPWDGIGRLVWPR